MAEEIAFLQKELEGGDKDSQEVYMLIIRILDNKNRYPYRVVRNVQLIVPASTTGLRV
jgi:hypothetical protein